MVAVSINPVLFPVQLWSLQPTSQRPAVDSDVFLGHHEMWTVLSGVSHCNSVKCEYVDVTVELLHGRLAAECNKKTSAVVRSHMENNNEVKTGCISRFFQ